MIRKQLNTEAKLCRKQERAKQVEMNVNEEKKLLMDENDSLRKHEYETVLLNATTQKKRGVSIDVDCKEEDQQPTKEYLDSFPPR